MRRLLLTTSLTILLVTLFYKDVKTEADVLFFWFGILILVCSILILIITSYAKTEEHNNSNNDL